MTCAHVECDVCPCSECACVSMCMYVCIDVCAYVCMCVHECVCCVHVSERINHSRVAELQVPRPSLPVPASTLTPKRKASQTARREGGEGVRLEGHKNPSLCDNVLAGQSRTK